MCACILSPDISYRMVLFHRYSSLTLHDVVLTRNWQDFSSSSCIMCRGAGLYESAPSSCYPACAFDACCFTCTLLSIYSMTNFPVRRLYARKVNGTLSPRTRTRDEGKHQSRTSFTPIWAWNNCVLGMSDRPGQLLANSNMV